eukprot:6907082-Prymnesium_polylepis.1
MLVSSTKCQDETAQSGHNVGRYCAVSLRGVERVSRRSLDFDDGSLLQRAGRRAASQWRRRCQLFQACRSACGRVFQAGGEPVVSPLPTLPGLSQCVRPRLAARGGAS